MKEAFKDAIPVIVGYVFVGIAFGLLLEKAGFRWWWALLMSFIVYAGSMQFVLIPFLAQGASLLTVALTTLAVNSRHMFYGISFLDLFKRMGKWRPYMIFSLTDETYSLMSIACKKGRENKLYYLYVSMINQFSWVFGSVLGALGGEYIPFNSYGIDFAMTALFLVIFIEQWLSSSRKLPGLAGLIVGLLMLLIFDKNTFILPALLLLSLLLLLFNRKKEEAK